MCGVKDICVYLGDTNKNRTVQTLDDDEKGSTQIATHGGAKADVDTEKVVRQAKQTRQLNRREDKA